MKNGKGEFGLKKATMRPGVTIEYQTIPSAGAESSGVIGLCVYSAGKAAGVLEAVKVCSASEGTERFGEDSGLCALLRAIFDNADCEVFVVLAAENEPEEFRAGLSLLFEMEEPYCILSSPADQSLLAFVAQKAEEYGKLYFGVLDGEAGPAEQIAAAHAVNSGRVLLAAPALLPVGGEVNVAAAVLAAMTVRQESPLSNLFGEEALGDYEIPAPFSEEEINNCLAEGVTVFEPGSFAPEVIRAVTSCTSPDLSRRNLSVTLLLDQVVKALQKALANRLAIAPVSLGDVTAVLEWELFLQQEAGWITGYDKPVVKADLEDTSLCHAAVAFRVKQGLAQVAVNVEIEV